MPLTKESYARILNEIDLSMKIHFYEMFAHNLTVSIRAIWSDPKTSDKEKITGMKEVNEVLHRIIAKISTERRQTHEWKEEDIFSMLKSVPDSKANSKGHVCAALKSTFQSLEFQILNQ